MLAFFFQLSQWLTIDIISPVLPLAEISNRVLRVRDSLRTTGISSWLFLSVLATAMGVLFLLAFWARWRSGQKIKLEIFDNPEQLFQSLLGQLDLSVEQKTVLNKMAADTRLRHPSQILLSPYLLNWSRNLWLKEKGRKAIGPKKLQTINDIADKLYDYHIESDLETRNLSGKLVR